ncbi:MAG: hypothetical protein HQL13_02685 [Candidatus Omnitrophica bacterium]|nr:hypothetical protein [Candidatus Omnitrophota bacterium]
MDFLLHIFNRMHRFLRHITSYKKTMVVLVGILALAACAYVGFRRGLPVPIIHDEFSYLLAGDTFAHGRITNPTHPVWKCFETFHELQKPSYMSRYPPMQGVFLAIGQKCCGHPVWGVWLSVALMCASICWMLQAWVSPTWALIGGLLAIIHPFIGAASPWAQTYMGGAAAAIGGAWVIGALKALSKKRDIGNAFIMAFGMAIVMNSRPFEGALFIMPILMLLVFWTFWAEKDFRKSFIRIALPSLIVVGILTVLAMGCYNKAITGRFFVMPCMLYEQTYSRYPVFIGQKERPVITFNNEQMRKFDGEQIYSEYVKYSKYQTHWQTIGDRFLNTYYSKTTVKGLLLIPFVLCLCLLFFRNKWILFLTATIGFYVVVQSSIIYNDFHYFAPFMGACFVMMMMGFRILNSFRFKQFPLGALLTIGYLVFIVYTGLVEMNKPDLIGARTWYKQRQGMIDSLKKQGGKHLILVGYGQGHTYHNEWVYNEADIDKAPVVWARSLDNFSNQALVRYFHDRKIWFLWLETNKSFFLPLDELIQIQKK